MSMISLPSYVEWLRAIVPGTACFLAFTLVPDAASATPLVPGKPTASCDTAIDGRCYVNADFTVSSPASGADHYRICRSKDTTSWGACDTVMTTDTSPSFTVSGSHLPSEGFRRAYYLSACDAVGDCTLWEDSEEIYVYMDSAPPTRVSQTVLSQNRLDDSDNSFQVALEATDVGSGVREVRALINPHDGNDYYYKGSSRGGQVGGYFSWLDDSLGYLWSADQVPCTDGGFASKHPTRFNPTSVTLVDCTTSTDGARRTVTFTIKPTPTLAELEPIHDVFFWARDFNLNGTSWQNFDHVLVSNRGNPVSGELFGYSGINDASQLAKVEAKGIPVNLAFLTYLNDETHPNYWRTVDTAGILETYRDRGVRAVAVFENFLFEIIPDADSPCFNHHTYRLRSDWLSRLEKFTALHGSQLNSEDVAMILMQSEVNDRCAVMSEVVMASDAVKQTFPDIPLTLAYGATHGHDGVLESQQPPPSLPDVFDGIGIFSYNLYNVNTPLEPRNATDKFYNPQDPEDPTTVYGDLLSKLKPHQKVHLIFDAHFSTRHLALGWAAEDLAMVALNYADFMISRPEVATLVGFHWWLGGASLGMSQLPQLAVDTNIKIACNYFPINCDNL